MLLKWLLAVLVAVAIAAFVLKRRPVDKIPVEIEGTGEVQWVDPASLKVGPVREVSLTAEQRSRIEALHRRLVPIDGWTLEKRLDLFSRDMHPDQEISINERIVDACDRAFAKLGPLALPQKREVYVLLLTASAVPVDEVLKHYTLKALTPEQAQVVLSVW